MTKKKVLIIPDIHGKTSLLQSMLDDHKDADRIIQLGDLANCVYGSQYDDLNCIHLAKEHNIEVLVGNHEHPYWGGPKFYGYGFIPEIREELLKGLNIHVATVVGSTLITHAGLHPAIGSQFANADQAACLINSVWHKTPTSMLFSAIGYNRGGSDRYGGILWRDYSERVTQKYPQVFGHTKDKTIRIRGNAVCIDCEAPYIMEE